MASDKYKNVRTEADQLAAKLEQRYNYYYSLSQMRKQVDTTPNVKMNLVDLIGKSIPSDTRITTYDLSGTTLTITGETFLSRSPNDFVNLIQKNETFTSQCDLKVSRISPDQFGEYTAFLKDNNDNTKVYSDVIYSFEVTGTLINDVYVSVSKFVKDETSDNKKISCLDVIPPEQVKVRKTWTINDIAKLEKNNVKYELVGITLNGRDIKKEDFDRIKGQDMYSIVVTSNTDIGLYYSVVQETAAEKNDADNKESEATK